ncbi:MAG: Dyp-type peroxidase [Flavobacteriaceae bacterium]|nr:Dyp-type peroxidase [Flavobacteriaceae bacterium]
MAIISNPKTLDLNDIQGMVVRGYGKLLETAYFLLEVSSAKQAKAWMHNILPIIDSADISSHSEKTLHLAFTPKGLNALGMDKDNLDNFPVPFRESIATEDRSRILGDYGENNPDRWRWGSNDDKLHMVLIFHAKDKPAMNTFIEEEKKRLNKTGGITIIKEMKGYLNPDNKEPFGFHDGISQPVIKGSGRSGPENDLIATGEFLMGYKNEHNQYPYSPLLDTDQGNTTLLKEDAAGSGKKDLGHNGTFMVFRQMEQHVDDFWNYMTDKTKNEDGSINEEAKIKLASKCIGRWPSGASLVNFPDKDPGGDLSNDDFGYADKDPDGLRCPYGSHLRRNNPRDAFRWYDKKQSLKVTRRHRIIRRGRTYEIPSNAGDDKKETGLHFICFNANLELQFEFIQHAWSNNNQLRHLSNDIDVIIGVPPEGDPNNEKRQFTIQAEPVNKYIDDWKRFVTIRGGEYYFFPSISVINYLTTI